MDKKGAPKKAADFVKMKAAEKGGKMKNGRKQYRNDFKAKVALKVIKGQKTLSEISSHYRVHLSQLMKWKKKVLEVLPGDIFKKQRKKHPYRR